MGKDEMDSETRTEHPARTADGPDIRLDRVVKHFGDTVAVDRLTLEIERGSFYALLGPSGCGKTTTLRMIGGFEDPTEGVIYLGGAEVTEHPPYRRGVNTGFQSYALFPHPHVGRKLAFRLPRQRIPQTDVPPPGGGAPQLLQ